MHTQQTSEKKKKSPVTEEIIKTEHQRATGEKKKNEHSQTEKLWNHKPPKIKLNYHEGFNSVHAISAIVQKTSMEPQQLTKVK